MNSHLFLFNEIAAIIAVTEANSGTQSDILNMIQSYNEFEKRDEYPASSSSNYESELVTFYDGYYNGANLSTAKSLYSDIYKQITEYPPFTEYMNR